MAKEVFLIFGKTGWIGGMLGELLEKEGVEYHYAESRKENRESVIAEIKKVKPTRILDAAGVTGRPNVDWCEDHKHETIRANVIGTLSLADIANELGIHMTLFATGCIFKYDDEHPIGGKKFTEEDDGNFTGSFYSYTKGLVEQILRFYPKLATLRVRMPISDDLSPRNFITKISTYAKVVNIPNSMTILHDMLPVAIEISRRQLSGIYNFTNPGAISHNEILELYKQYIDPEFTWVNFSEEEQNKILKAQRSNNELDTDKLVKHFPKLVPVKEGMHGVFQRMKKNLDAAGIQPPKRQKA